MTESAEKVRVQKILWAVDAFADNLEVQMRSGRAVRGLLEVMPATIHPVYIARPVPPGLFVQADPTLNNSYVDRAKKNLNELFDLLDLSNIAPPHFLDAPTPTVGSQVKTLIDYAEREKFDLIVVGTHCRRGVPRLFLGSFAEKLILESPLPVLVASPKARLPVRKLKHIVFPTDFSNVSREVFERVIALAKSLRVDIAIFHHEDFIEPQMAYPFIIPPVSQASLDEMREGWKKLGEEWIEMARAQGVSAKFQSAHGISAPSEIVKFADKLPNSMIAMASQSNHLETALMGSVARQVVRSSTRPVYIFHPTRKRKAEPLFQLTEDDLPALRNGILS